jgi:hypothetical protein
VVPEGIGGHAAEAFLIVLVDPHFDLGGLRATDELL